MAIKHVPRQTSHSVLICPPNEYVTAISGGHLIQCGGPNGLMERLTQGAAGTPSIGGNALKFFLVLSPKIDKSISTDTKLHCILYRQLVKFPWLPWSSPMV